MSPKQPQVKVDDIVVLRSGGPKMVVTDVELNFGETAYNVHCTWFAGKKHETGVFSPGSLKVVDEDEADDE